MITAADAASWRSRLLRGPENASLLPWLAGRGSLTARIQARGRFAVHVLRQGLACPNGDEAPVLGIEPGASAWVREVMLSCDGRIVVFAHTVLPCVPRGPVTVWLARLGNRSLGAMLFAHPGFARGPMHFRRLNQRHPLFTSAARVLADGDQSPRTLWARRSLFAFAGQSVLVTEVFSPRVVELDRTVIAGGRAGSSVSVRAE